MSNPSQQPFEVEVTGSAEIPHSAERGCFNLLLSNSGTDKAQVVGEVISTAKRIEVLLRDLSPQDDTPEAKASAALAHWDKTSLSSTSHTPYGKDNQELPRQYTATVQYDIRFQDFKAIGSFGTTVSSLPYVEVQDIQWTLTSETEKSFRSELRRQAAQDAYEKAKDYCSVLGCTNLRPVELSEGGSYTHARTGRQTSTRAKQTARKAYSGPSVMRQMASTPSRASSEVVETEDLVFGPQELRMGMSVTIKFHADQRNLEV